MKLDAARYYNKEHAIPDNGGTRLSLGLVNNPWGMSNLPTTVPRYCRPGYLVFFISYDLELRPTWHGCLNVNDATLVIGNIFGDF